MGNKVKKGDKWVVETFDDICSHELSSLSKVTKIRSHKQMTTTSKKLIDGLYSCGIGPSNISRVLNHRNSGMDVGDFTAADCKNHLVKASKNNVGRHCLKVFGYFQRKARTKEGLLKKMEVDENNQIRSVFWLIIDQDYHICNSKMLSYLT